MTIYDRIKYLREQLGLSQQELAEKVGFKTASAVNKIELGLRDINQSKIIAFAKALNTTPSYLMGWDESDQQSFDYSSIPGIMPLPKTVKRPRLGTIACGEPIMTEENFDGYDDVPDGIPCDFTLICEGDSMINARIHDGDIVYIKQQPTVENGQIAAIMIDGETTLKRVYIDGDRLTTIPENPAYKPHTYIGEELNNIRIIGLATGFTSTLT